MSRVPGLAVPIVLLRVSVGTVQLSSRRSARWPDSSINRALHSSDAGVFAAEVGFGESKNYVFKVMSYYRAYRQLYDANLNRR